MFLRWYSTSLTLITSCEATSRFLNPLRHEPGDRELRRGQAGASLLTRIRDVAAQDQHLFRRESLGAMSRSVCSGLALEEGRCLAGPRRGLLSSGYSTLTGWAKRPYGERLRESWQRHPSDPGPLLT